VCYEVQNFLLWNGEKNTAKTQPFPLPRQKKKQKFLDLTERGKSNDIAHGSIIQVSTVDGLEVVLPIIISSTNILLWLFHGRRSVVGIGNLDYTVLAKITSKRKEKKLKLIIEDERRTLAVSINPNAQLAERRRR